MNSHRSLRFIVSESFRDESSRRTPGPIIRGGYIAEGVYPRASMIGHGVWVPAFAGTTQIVSDC